MSLLESNDHRIENHLSPSFSLFKLHKHSVRKWGRERERERGGGGGGGGEMKQNVSKETRGQFTCFHRSAEPSLAVQRRCLTSHSPRTSDTVPQHTGGHWEGGWPAEEEGGGRRI